MLGQGLEGGVGLEGLSEFASKALESLIAPAGAEVRPERLEDRPQHTPDARVIHKRHVAQGLDALAHLGEKRGGAAAGEPRQGRRVDMQRLEEKPRRGGMGREFRAVGCEERMHRAEADEGRAERAGAGRRLGRVAIGADAEVVPGPEAVELRREAPSARALRQLARLEAARRCRDQGRFAALTARLDGQPVITRRKARQRQSASGKRGAAVPRAAAVIDEAPDDGVRPLRVLQRDARRPLGLDRNEARHETMA
jgi:hypothetical protein